jgi:SAM-dependent methyltransferase
MPENENFWNFYWEVRLQELQNLGKKEAVLAASGLIRKLAADPDRPVRLLELGCGEGQIIGILVEGHAQVKSIHESVGIDYNPRSIETCRRRFPMMRFVEGDFTLSETLDNLGQFELVMMVNALHEVFSDSYSQELKEVDVPAAKENVLRALDGAATKLAVGGYLLLFDGLEMMGDIRRKVRLKFRNPQALDHFLTFVREYHPFKISYRELGSPYRIELSQRDFTRYITKSIFLGKGLWRTERLESYQYFNQAEFHAAFNRLGLSIVEQRTLTVDEEKWNRQVQIESRGIGFPEEHILIIAQKKRG